MLVMEFLRWWNFLQSIPIFMRFLHWVSNPSSSRNDKMKLSDWLQFVHLVHSHLEVKLWQTMPLELVTQTSPSHRVLCSQKQELVQRVSIKTKTFVRVDQSLAKIEHFSYDLFICPEITQRCNIEHLVINTKISEVALPNAVRDTFLL